MTEGQKIMPVNWDLARLGDVLEFKYGKALPREARDGKGFSVYGSNGIVGLHSQPLVEGPCLIIGRKGSIGAVHLSNENCWPIDTTYYVNEFFDQPVRYWYYLLKNLHLEELNRASAIPGLNRDDAYGKLIPVAPREEQRRIVAKVEELFARVDACRKRLEQIPRLLKQFRHSVLSAACSGKLTADWREQRPNTEPAEILVKAIAPNAALLLADDLPSTWVRCKLSDLSELITKGASPKWQGVKYSDEGVLFVTSENVGWGEMLLSDKKYVQVQFNTLQKRSILKRGDLLTNIVGASIGRAAVFELDEVANINQAVAVIRLYEPINKQYIKAVLNSPALVYHMHGEKVDVARANLSLKDVGDFPISFPPVAEQNEIAYRVEALFKIANAVEDRYRQAREQLDKLPQSILAKAFRGDLIPQDPNDEPASRLIKRIRSDRLMQ